MQKERTGRIFTKLVSVGLGLEVGMRGSLNIL